MRDIAEITKDIESLHFESSASQRMIEFADELETHPEAAAAIPTILSLFERNADQDFGKPGPLVHVIEKFYLHGYEHELEKSLQRAPTAFTVWLAHRIANANDSNSSRFIALLEQVDQRNDIDEHTRMQAKQFLMLHR